MQSGASSANVLTVSFGNGAGSGGGEHTVIDEVIVCTNCNPAAAPDSESVGAEVLVGETVYSGPAGVKTWNDIPSANIKTWNDIAWNTIKTMN